jgi:hypothetical protein
LQDRVRVTTGVAKSAYAVWIAVLGVPIFFLGLAAQRDVATWVAIAIILAVLSLVLMSLARRRLCITSDMIEYRTLFHTRRASIADVASAEVQMGPRSLRDWWRPPVRLVLTLRRTEECGIQINLKVFPQEAVRELVVFADMISIERSGDAK